MNGVPRPTSLQPPPRLPIPEQQPQGAGGLDPMMLLQLLLMLGQGGMMQGGVPPQAPMDPMAALMGGAGGPPLG